MDLVSEKRVVSTAYGEISYELSIKDVKNINLRIRSDCSVHISANETVDKAYIDSFVSKKSAYIYNALDNFREQLKYQSSDKKYVSGESFAYLGKNLRLKLKCSDKNSAYSDGIYLYLLVKNTQDMAQKEKCVNKWLTLQCNTVFDEVMSEVYKTFSRYISSKPKLKLKNMASRWGSCQVKSETITLNRRLIEVPRYCIEYVITHEFVHFIHPNHSKSFYSFLSTIMPDWKERKRQLEKYFYGE